MDKMRMESVYMTAQNIDKIEIMFLNCITEAVDEKGKPKKAINFELLKRQPLRAVFRDSSFANSPAKINVTEIFKLLTPDTRVKVL